MGNFFKKIGDGLLAVGMRIGNFMSAVIMTIFYFTVFALFAIPFRCFSRPLSAKSPRSNWLDRNKTFSTGDFDNEF